jgi:signal peptidase II
MRRPTGYVFLALGILALDQLTKGVVGAVLSPNESIPLFWGAKVRIVHNTGGAFGLFPNQGALLTAFSAAVAVGLWVALRWGRLSGRTAAGAALILAGAVGNLIDRLRLGYVLDFIELPHWPVFNLADAAIVIGVVLLGWGLLRAGRGGEP